MKENIYNFANPEINSEKWLYHYTSFETAIKYILPSGTLKMGEYGRVNDPKEAKLNPNTYNFGQLPSDKEERNIFVIERDEVCKKITDYFFHQIKIVCFSVDDLRYEKTLFHYFARGCIKPRMWAQYGDNNKGVCLIFDRNILEKQIEQQFQNEIKIYSGNVKYQSCQLNNENWELQNQIDSNCNNFSLTDFKNNFEDAIEKQVDNFWETYFFHKYEDWNSENEFRFVIHSQKAGDFFLNYGDALAGIVVGNDFPNYHEDALVEIAQKLEIPATQFLYGIGWSNQRTLGSQGLGQIHVSFPERK